MRTARRNAAEKNVILNKLEKTILSSKDILEETEAVGVLGSLARDDFNERSDVDIFVVLKDDMQGMDQDMYWYEKMRGVMRDIDRRLSVFVYTVQSLKDICCWYVLRLASEGVLIHDKANIKGLFRKIVQTAIDAGLEEKELDGRKYWDGSKVIKLGERFELRVIDDQ